MKPFLLIENPCGTIQVVVSNKVKDISNYAREIAGSYTLRPKKTTGGRPDWLSDDGKFAIYYKDGDQQWCIGTVSARVSARESHFTGVYIFAISKRALPTEEGIKYNYDVNSAWVEATYEDFHLKCGASK